MKKFALLLMLFYFFSIGCGESDSPTTDTKSSEAKLTSLTVTVNSHDYQVTYASTETVKTIELPNTVTSPVIGTIKAISISPEAKSSVTVNGELNFGNQNSATIDITAEDKTKKTYTLNAKISPATGTKSSEAKLVSLTVTVNSHDYQVTYASTETVKTIELPNTVTSPVIGTIKAISISPEAKSSVTVNGELNFGNQNSATIDITAEDKTKKTYTLNAKINLDKGKLEQAYVGPNEIVVKFTNTTNNLATYSFYIGKTATPPATLSSRAKITRKFAANASRYIMLSALVDMPDDISTSTAQNFIQEDQDYYIYIYDQFSSLVPGAEIDGNSLFHSAQFTARPSDVRRNEANSMGFHGWKNFFGKSSDEQLRPYRQGMSDEYVTLDSKTIQHYPIEVKVDEYIAIPFRFVVPILASSTPTTVSSEVSIGTSEIAFFHNVSGGIVETAFRIGAGTSTFNPGILQAQLFADTKHIQFSTSLDGVNSYYQGILYSLGNNFNVYLDSENQLDLYLVPTLRVLKDPLVPGSYNYYRGYKTLENAIKIVTD